MVIAQLQYDETYVDSWLSRSLLSAYFRSFRKRVAQEFLCIPPSKRPGSLRRMWTLKGESLLTFAKKWFKSVIDTRICWFTNCSRSPSESWSNLTHFGWKRPFYSLEVFFLESLIMTIPTSKRIIFNSYLKILQGPISYGIVKLFISNSWKQRLFVSSRQNLQTFRK